MATGANNIHLTADRFAELACAAQAQGQSPDELADEAIAMPLRRRRLEDLMEYGQRAQELGIKQDDVDRLIHEGRAESRARGR